jgi:hypothetical protein
MKIHGIILVALLLASCSKEPQLTYVAAIEFTADTRDVGKETVVAVVGTTNGPFHYAGCGTLGEGQPGAFGYKSKDGASISWKRPANETSALNCYTFLDDSEHPMLVIKKRKAE